MTEMRSYIITWHPQTADQYKKIVHGRSRADAIEKFRNALPHAIIDAIWRAPVDIDDDPTPRKFPE